MYPDIRQIKRASEERRVVIREVNSGQRLIIAQDAHGAYFHMGIQLVSPLVTLPEVGEVWVASRNGLDWTLDRKLEGDSITAIEAMSPGDTRLETPATLYLNGGEGVVLNFGGRKLYVQDGVLSYEAEDGTITQLAPTIEEESEPEPELESEESIQVEATELAFVTVTTSPVNIDGTTAAAATPIITATPIDLASDVALMIEVYTFRTQRQTADVRFVLFEDGVQGAHLFQVDTSSGQFFRWRHDALAGTHTYSIRAYSSDGSGLIEGPPGGGITAYVRITRVT